MANVAIIEDNVEVNNHLKELVESVSDTVVSQYFDRCSAEIAIQQEQFDLVVLDIELGQAPKDKYGGLQILSQLRGKRTVTLVVSGTSEESLPDIVISLQAYDFIGKPINDLNFLNTLEHALHWQQPELSEEDKSEKTKVWPAGLAPDPDRHPGFMWKNTRVRLTLTQIRLINCLIRHPGQPVDKSQLAKQLDSSNSTAAIATHMSDIRHRFTDVDPNFNSIIVDPGKGYVWSA
jgi:two-component system OmpR family response regulator